MLGLDKPLITWEMGGVYQTILNSKNRIVALLLDPDKQSVQDVKGVLALANSSKVSLILVGGSLVNSNVDDFLSVVKANTKLPVLLFPGSAIQFSPIADGILLLSLISGRNPEFLIGNHVQVAYKLKQSGIEIIPTGYILIESGNATSVAVEFASLLRNSFMIFSDVISPFK